MGNVPKNCFKKREREHVIILYSKKGFVEEMDFREVSEDK